LLKRIKRKNRVLVGGEKKNAERIRQPSCGWLGKSEK